MIIVQCRVKADCVSCRSCSMSLVMGLLQPHPTMGSKYFQNLICILYIYICDFTRFFLNCPFLKLLKFGKFQRISKQQCYFKMALSPFCFIPSEYILAGEQASQYSCGSAAACLPISFLPFLMIFSRPNQWNSFKFQFEKQLLRLSFTAARNSLDQRRELALATVYNRAVSS